MKELHGTEWYGEYATLTDEHNDYVQIEYKCNGTGRLYDYTLFPGIDLIFMDFNCSDGLRTKMDKVISLVVHTLNNLGNRLFFFADAPKLQKIEKSHQRSR